MLDLSYLLKLILHLRRQTKCHSHTDMIPQWFAESWHDRPVRAVGIALAGGPAAVDDDRLPGHVPPGVTDEPQDRSREVVDGPVGGKRGVAPQPRSRALVVVQPIGDLAAEEPRGDRVHPDGVPGPLHGQLAPNPPQPPLAAV